MGSTERLIAEVVVVEPTRRVRKRRVVPDIPEMFGEKPLYWWSTDVPIDGEWHFVFVSPETLLLIAERVVYGFSVYQTRTVYLSSELLERGAERRLRGTFLHELFHIYPFSLECVQRIRQLWGTRPKFTLAREEAWVEHLSSSMDPLFDTGVIRLPPLPRIRRSS